MMALNILLVFLTAFFFLFSFDLGRLKDKILAALCSWGIVATIMIIWGIYYNCQESDFVAFGIFELIFFLFFALHLVMPHFIIKAIAYSVAKRHRLDSDNFKRRYKKMAKAFTFILLPILLIIYHLADQADKCGNQSCLEMCGLNIEKDYGGQFIPTYEFMPNPNRPCFKFHMCAQDFNHLEHELLKEHGCAPWYGFMGDKTDIAQKDEFWLVYVKSIWERIRIRYQPSQELLYIDQFSLF